MRKLSKKEKNNLLLTKKDQTSSLNEKEKQSNHKDVHKKSRFSAFKESLKHSWNPFYYNYDQNNSFDHKTKKFIKIASIIIGVLLVSAIAINYSLNTNSGTRVIYKKHVNNQYNISAVGAYKRDGNAYKLLSYTDNKGLWGVEYLSETSQIGHKGLINNSTKFDNPLMVQQLLLALQHQKIINANDSFSILKDGIKVKDVIYKPTIKNAMVVSYTTNKNKQVHYLDQFYNNITVQPGQIKLLKKHNIELNQIIITDVSYVEGLSNISFEYQGAQYLLTTDKNGHVKLHYN